MEIKAWEPLQQSETAVVAMATVYERYCADAVAWCRGDAPDAMASSSACCVACSLNAFSPFFNSRKDNNRAFVAMVTQTQQKTNRAKKCSTVAKDKHTHSELTIPIFYNDRRIFQSEAYSAVRSYFPTTAPPADISVKLSSSWFFFCWRSVSMCLKFSFSAFIWRIFFVETHFSSIEYNIIHNWAG